MAGQRITIIGGGIVGLAVAERVSRSGGQVTLLEKEDHWAAHQTGHNSGVIHSGIYYTPGSLRARLCTAGNRSMVAFAAKHGIPHEVCGKLIVAVSAAEVPRLRALHDRALANGVPARLISAAEARDVEPNVACVLALVVESTGIIDYSQVSGTLAELATAHGAQLLLGARAIDISVGNTGVTVTHTSGSVTSDLVVNCAGLQSDRVAIMAGLNPRVRIVPFRGEYFALIPSQRHLVKGLIYPVPDPALPFLGVHLTRMTGGAVHAGPNAVLALAREGYRWSTIDLKEMVDSVSYPGFLRLARQNIVTGGKEILRSLSKRLFAASIARLVPAIGVQDLIRAGSGVRAQAILPNGTLADDFIIQRAPHQIHLLNAPSPAATSSLEIARHLTHEAGLE